MGISNSKLKPQSSKLFFLTVIITFTLLLFLGVAAGFAGPFTLTSAEPDCNNPGPGDIDYCLQKIQQEIDALTPAQEYNKQELADLRSQITNFEKRISGISKQLTVTEVNIQKREEDMAYAKEVFEEKTNNHYR